MDVLQSADFERGGGGYPVLVSSTETYGLLLLYNVLALEHGQLSMMFLPVKPAIVTSVFITFFT